MALNFHKCLIGGGFDPKTLTDQGNDGPVIAFLNYMLGRGAVLNTSRAKL